MEYCNHVFVDENLSLNVHIDKIGKRLSLALVLDCLSLNLALELVYFFCSNLL